jgi:hypothetical protein
MPTLQYFRRFVVVRKIFLGHISILEDAEAFLGIVQAHVLATTVVED